MQLARKIARMGAAAAAPVLLIGLAGPSFADDISNDLDASVDADAESMALTAGGADGTTRLDVIPLNGDGKSGCNLNQNNGQTLTVAVTSSNPLVAVASPPTITFTSCGARPTVTVSPIGGGTAEVTFTPVLNTTGATFNFATASFDVDVAASNTAPAVAVTGVADGSSYAKGGVPSATCEVTDAEDGPSSFAATLSDVTGPNSADGIGSQTATCSYTDAGGLSDDDAATYDVVDSSKPSISYDLSPAVPDGENGWFASDVSVDWTVSDGESPGSLTSNGCDDVSITADQAASTYTCSADSAGGHDEATTEAIKVDATDPTLDLTGGPADGATYYFGLETVPAAPTCTAEDTTSGVNGDGCVVDGWSDQLGSHSMAATVKDDAGNTASVTRNYSVVECNLETSAIGSVCAPQCQEELVTIKGAGGGPIVGTEGDDVIIGTDGDDEINGLGGNDVICGSGGVDAIDAGAGNDRVHGGMGADVIDGGADGDILLGAGGDDSLNGGDGDDEITGHSGNDTADGGNGSDTIVGSAGDDALDGAGGDDLVDGSFGADSVAGGSGQDQLLGGPGVDDLRGGDDDDTLKGHAGNDSHDGGAGADILIGAEGIDTFTGGEGDDAVYGGLHADSAFGGDGHDVLHGGFGNDALHGEAGNDTLNGNEGEDTLVGGDGDDRLVGGPDVDVLDGGSGINVMRT